MDNSLVARDSFDDYLAYLANVLQRCEECNLVLNWEKCPFYGERRVFLKH